jgi:hypothetical protein
MTTEQPTDKQPGRPPIVVRAGDLQAFANRLEAKIQTDNTQTDRDLHTAARLARHAAVTLVGGFWVSGFAAVSLG